MNDTLPTGVPGDTRSSRFPIIIVGVVALLLLGAFAALALLAGTRILTQFGVGAPRITDATVIGLDVQNRPVLKVRWDGRPLTPNQEWYDITFHRAGVDLAIKLGSSTTNEIYYAFDEPYNTTPASVIVTRQREGVFSESVSVNFPPLDTLKPLKGEDIGVDVSRMPALEMRPPALIPYLDPDGKVMIEFDWTPDSRPANVGWWVWYNERNSQWIPVPDDDANNDTEELGNWRGSGLLQRYKDPTPLLKEGESCLPVAVMVQMVYFTNNVAVVLDEETMPACVPPAAKVKKK